MYALVVVSILKNVQWAKVSVLYDQIGTPIHLGSFGPIGLNFGPTIDPILVHLTQISPGVSSNNIMYALVVVSILKNVQ